MCHWLRQCKIDIRLHIVSANDLAMATQPKLRLASGHHSEALAEPVARDAGGASGTQSRSAADQLPPSSFSRISRMTGWPLPADSMQLQVGAT